MVALARDIHFWKDPRENTTLLMYDWLWYKFVRNADGCYLQDLFEGGLESLEYLHNSCVSSNLRIENFPVFTNLELNFGFSNILFASTAAGNLLCLGDLVSDSLCGH